MPDHEPATLIQADALRHRFGTRTVLSLPAWRVTRGRHCLILGPSGAGKSTLIHIVTGLTRPSEGQIRVQGQDLFALSPGQRDRARGRLFGIVFQSLRLISSLSVRDNLRLARSLAGMPADPARLDGLLDAVGLSYRAGAKPRQLSLGEAQRAAIARAAAAEPAILIADEPTSALVRVRAEQVMALLTGLCERSGATLIAASHDERITGHFADTLTLTSGEAMAA